MSIADRFLVILERCAFTPADVLAFATHRREVETCLESAFEIAKCEVIGSYARGSAIRQSSDLDLLLVLRKPELTWGQSYKTSRTVLDAVRDRIRGRFPATDVGRDGQAVVVPFADGRSIDVVPAGWIRQQADNWPLYMIPNGDGRWLETAPASHARFITLADERSGGKLKNVARIFKYWKQSRASVVPISSFHVELLMAANGTCGVGMSYGECFARLLILLHGRECRPLQDPIAISGLIPACGSDSKRSLALQTIAASWERANAALLAEASRDTAESVRLWNIVFNGWFPR